MAGPSNKRQKREAYQASQAALLAAAAAGGPGAEGAVGTSSNGNEGKQGKGKGRNGGGVELPRKKFYRQRAHANPFSDHALVYPESPEKLDWSSHFPYFVDDKASAKSPNGGQENDKPLPLKKQVEIADIGCGFGGLLVALSPVYPDTLMVGMELRNQVLSYVTSRIHALRSQNLPQNISSEPSTQPPPYSNISALRTNTMKFLPQHFPQASLSKIFLCFPDPHFKQRKHKARIVSRSLCAEYAYVLRRGTGLVYTITDVEELHLWMARCFDGPKRRKAENEPEDPNAEQAADLVDDGEIEEDDEDEAGDATTSSGSKHPGVESLFERLTEEELERDPCVKIMSEETEEGKKVTRNGGKKYIGVWRRKADPEWL